MPSVFSRRHTKAKALKRSGSKTRMQTKLDMRGQITLVILESENNEYVISIDLVG